MNSGFNGNSPFPAQSGSPGGTTPLVNNLAGLETADDDALSSPTKGAAKGNPTTGTAPATTAKTTGASVTATDKFDSRDPYRSTLKMTSVQQNTGAAASQPMSNTELNELYQTLAAMDKSDPGGPSKKELADLLQSLSPGQLQQLYGQVQSKTSYQLNAPPDKATIDTSKPADFQADQTAAASAPAATTPASSGDDDPSYALLQKGQTQFENQDYKGALASFSAAFKANPTLGQSWPAVYYYLGVSAEYCGDSKKLAQAQDYFQAYANSANPDPQLLTWVKTQLSSGLKSQILIASAEAAYKKNDYAGAFKDYSAALKADPTLKTNWPAIDYYLGLTAEYSEKPEMTKQALGFYKEYLASPNPDPKTAEWVKSEANWLEFKPQAEAAVANAAYRLNQNDAQGAANELKDALNKYPQLKERQPDTLYSMALYDYSASHVGEAKDYLAQAKAVMEAGLKKDPKSKYYSYYLEQINSLEAQANDPLGNLSTTLASLLGGGNLATNFFSGISQGWFQVGGKELFPGKSKTLLDINYDSRTGIQNKITSEQKDQLDAIDFGSRPENKKKLAAINKQLNGGMLSNGLKGEQVDLANRIGKAKDAATRASLNSQLEVVNAKVASLTTLQGLAEEERAALEKQHAKLVAVARDPVAAAKATAGVTRDLSELEVHHINEKNAAQLQAQANERRADLDHASAEYELAQAQGNKAPAKEIAELQTKVAQSAAQLADATDRANSAAAASAQLNTAVRTGQEEGHKVILDRANDELTTKDKVVADKQAVVDSLPATADKKTIDAAQKELNTAKAEQAAAAKNVNVTAEHAMNPQTAGKGPLQPDPGGVDRAPARGRVQVNFATGKAGGKGGAGWWGMGTTTHRAQATLFQWHLGPDANGNFSATNWSGPSATLSNIDPTMEQAVVAKGGEGMGKYTVSVNGGVDIGNAEARTYDLFYSGNTQGGVGIGGGMGAEARLNAIDENFGVSYTGQEISVGGEKFNFLSSSVSEQGSVGGQAGGDGMFYAGSKGFGVGVGGNAFAGAIIGGMASGSILGVGGSVMVQGWAGVGVKVTADVSVKNGVLSFNFGIGAALGLGGFVGFNITIDFNQIAKELKGVAVALGNQFKDAGLATASGFMNTIHAAGDAFSEANKAQGAGNKIKAGLKGVGLAIAAPFVAIGQGIKSFFSKW